MVKRAPVNFMGRILLEFVPGEGQANYIQNILCDK
jgi:hypothetical protein